MKRMFIFLLLPLAPVVGLLGWANHLDEPLPDGIKADLVVIEKSKRKLIVYTGGRLLKTYVVSLGRVPVGPKEREGDKKTPEGKYTIDYRKEDSGYFRALHISYPGQADLDAAQKIGVSPRGDIMIHGIRNGLGWLGKLHLFADWTLGCVAVTNQEMDELWRILPEGTSIVLKP